MSDSETDDILACPAYFLFDDEEEEKQRRIWVKDIFKGSQIFGQFHTLYQETRTLQENQESFFR